MQTLDPEETAAAIASYGLDQNPLAAFAFRDRGSDLAYDWHAHDHHQLLYATSGVAQLEVAEARYVLPPQRAAWIPAGVRHRTILSSVDGASVFLPPSSVAFAGDRVRILAVTPLLREMTLYALRWPPPGDVAPDALARSYFETFARMCEEWLRAELRLELPRSNVPAITRAMDYALADPGAATLAGAIAVARLSERTFRRRFAEETGADWRGWLGQARIMAAMALLERGGRVTDVAAEVGFASLSAFAGAFSRMVGESPAAYRRLTQTVGPERLAAFRGRPGAPISGGA